MKLSNILLSPLVALSMVAASPLGTHVTFNLWEGSPMSPPPSKPIDSPGAVCSEESGNMLAKTFIKHSNSFCRLLHRFTPGKQINTADTTHTVRATELARPGEGVETSYTITLRTNYQDAFEVDECKATMAAFSNDDECGGRGPEHNEMAGSGASGHYSYEITGGDLGQNATDPA